MERITVSFDWNALEQELEFLSSRPDEERHEIELLLSALETPR